MTDFTLLEAITASIGGMLIGLSAVILLAFNGRIAGISGIVGGLLASARPWRLSFVVGLLVGGLFGYAIAPERFGTDSPASLPVLAVAGLLVGFGTRLGSGCTSGHGVCGLSRFSIRSLVATVVFMVVAAATVFATHHIGGAT